MGIRADWSAASGPAPRAAHSVSSSYHTPAESPDTRVWRTLPSGSWVSSRVRPPLTYTWETDWPLPPLQKVSTTWVRL